MRSTYLRRDRSLSIVHSMVAQSQPASKTEATSRNIKVSLLGTAAGPPVRLKRYQVSTLIEAGGEHVLFDCGRGTLVRLTQAGVPLGSVTKLFITHLHSDHIVGIPDLYLTPWASALKGQRKVPLEVWGPVGTRSMMDHLGQAFSFDIHIRRDVDEHFTAEGIKVTSHDVEQGVIYDHSRSRHEIETVIRIVTCIKRLSSALAQDFDARHRMYLIPAVIAVGNVGSGNADAIADLRNCGLGVKITAGGQGIGLAGRMVANYLDYEFAVGVHHVD